MTRMENVRPTYVKRIVKELTSETSPNGVVIKKIIIILNGRNLNLFLPAKK